MVEFNDENQRAFNELQTLEARAIAEQMVKRMNEAASFEEIKATEKSFMLLIKKQDEYDYGRLFEMYFDLFSRRVQELLESRQNMPETDIDKE